VKTHKTAPQLQNNVTAYY